MTLARLPDRSSPLPLWAQVASDLRRRLAAGELGDRFPTDRELAEQYEVSRNTVREAVRQLGDEGLLDRRRGRGTTVRQAELEQPLGGTYSLARSVEEQGLEATSRVLSLDERREPQVARRLDLKADAALVYLERLRFAGGIPLALDRAWLPADLARPLLGVDFGHTALYDELASRCGVGFVEGEERILPVLMTPSERGLLAVRSNQAAFAIERLTRSGERAIELRRSLVRGDRYAFVSRFSGRASPAPQLGEPSASLARGPRLGA